MADRIAPENRSDLFLISEDTRQGVEFVKNPRGVLLAVTLWRAGEAMPMDVWTARRLLAVLEQELAEPAVLRPLDLSCPTCGGEVGCGCPLPPRDFEIEVPR